MVEVEADAASGLPAFLITGLPDAALGEARDRVRAAINNSGLPFTLRRLTVNLSPASLPKAGNIVRPGHRGGRPDRLGPAATRPGQSNT